MSGIPNAAVLPDPVSACPMTFFSPFNRSGITCAWIGDGSINHFLVNAWSVLSDNQRSVNVVIGLISLLVKDCYRIIALDVKRLTLDARFFQIIKKVLICFFVVCLLSQTTLVSVQELRLGGQ